MIFTRLGYFVIIAIIAVAGSAIAFVAWQSTSGGSSSTSAVTARPSATSAPLNLTATPVPPPASDAVPAMDFARVVEFVRYGAVTSIEVDPANNMTVVFRDDWDPGTLNTTAHTFRSSLPPGQDVVTTIRAAGIKVGADGVKVVQH